MSRRVKIMMLVVLAVLAASSFYLRVLVRRVFFETRPQGEESVRARLSEAALQPTKGANQQPVTLYFPSYNEGKLRGETRPIAVAANETDRIRQILLALIEGPSAAGHSRSLPPSTDVRAVFLTSDGTAYLDFSSAVLAEFAPGIESETLAVYSIVDSLAANIAGVKKVKILVQGQEVDTLDGHADLTDYFVPDPERIASP